MVTDKIKVERIYSMRDAQEFILEYNKGNERYIVFMEVSGIRAALDREPIKYFIDKVKKQFKEMVDKGDIRPEDKLKFGFLSKGDYIINQNKNPKVDIDLTVSKYSNERLHIEIPVEFRKLFSEGDKVKVKK